MQSSLCRDFESMYLDIQQEARNINESLISLSVTQKLRCVGVAKSGLKSRVYSEYSERRLVTMEGAPSESFESRCISSIFIWGR